MKFSGSIDIDKPLHEVVAFFKDPKYLGEYQDGFLRKKLVNGTEGADGAVSKMYYKQGKKEMELTETITANLLPDSFAANYHHKHMDNTLKSTFTALDVNRTRYVAEGEYTAFRGFLPNMMKLFFPSLFSKQAQKWMDNFKAFVENQG